MRDDGLVLLNAGCGSVQPEGWYNVDRSPVPGAVLANFDHLGGLGYPAPRFDGIVANHSLQQIGHHDLPPTFRELARVTKPGGWLRVLVPDVVAGFEAFKRMDRPWFPISEEDCPSIGEAFSRWLTWYGENVSCFTIAYLVERAATGGWTRMKHHGKLPPAAFELDDRLGESLIVTFQR